MTTRALNLAVNSWINHLPILLWHKYALTIRSLESQKKMFSQNQNSCELKCPPKKKTPFPSVFSYNTLEQFQDWKLLSADNPHKYFWVEITFQRIWWIGLKAVWMISGWLLWDDKESSKKNKNKNSDELIGTKINVSLMESFHHPVKYLSSILGQTPCVPCTP